MMKTIKEDLQRHFRVDQIIFLLKCLYSNYVEEDLGSTDLLGYGSTQAVLTAPLIEAAGADRELYYSIRKSRYCKVNEFAKDKLFCGGGHYSSNRIARLHQRLAFAVSCLSGEEQNGGMGTEFNEESSRDANNNIKDVLLDIIRAFGIKPKDLVTHEKFRAFL
jgi:hypothetical protein